MNRLGLLETLISTFSKIPCGAKAFLYKLRGCAGIVRLLPLLLLLPAVVKAQLTYTTNGDNTITITGFTGSPPNTLIIPNSILVNGTNLPVTSIGDRAFQSLYFLTNVTMPDSITSIGSGAFTYCPNLANVTIGSGVTNIASIAFMGCTALTSIIFPDNDISIGASAFSGCTGLTNILLPNNAASIGNSAFQGCTKLTGIVIPDNLVSIGDQAFSSCNGLTNVMIGKGVVNIGNAPFQDCTNLKNVAVDALNSAFICTNGVLLNKDQTFLCEFLPGKVERSYDVPNTITSIGGFAFCDCTSLTNITIPDSVTNIGSSAFGYCTGLTNLVLPDSVVWIASEAFECCFGLNSITIPNASIGDSAFYYCLNLTNVTFGSGITNIGSAAFEWCSRLTTVTIPRGITRVGLVAFYSCSSLRSVYFKGNSPTGDDPDLFGSDPFATVYYLPGTTGWGATFGGRPTALWTLPYPLILSFEPNFGVRSNSFSFTISWATNVSIAVEACGNLGGPWTSLQSVSLTNGCFYFSDPAWTNYPSRFYRIRSP